MVSYFLNRQKSLRNKLLTIIIGVTVFALLISSGIGLTALYIADMNRGDVNWDAYQWQIIITMITVGLGAIFAHFLALNLLPYITKPIFHLS